MPPTEDRPGVLVAESLIADFIEMPDRDGRSLQGPVPRMMNSTVRHLLPLTRHDQMDVPFVVWGGLGLTRLRGLERVTSSGQACPRSTRACSTRRTRVNKRACSSPPETSWLFTNSRFARDCSRQSSDLAVYLGIADIAAAFLRHRTSKEGRSFPGVPA